jgi:hypothetical protein
MTNEWRHGASGLDNDDGFNIAARNEEIEITFVISLDYGLNM